MKWNKWYLLVILFVFTGCHQAKNNVPQSMLTGEAVIAADESLLPMINAEIDVFHSLYNYSSIDCKFVSEYEAINFLLQEKTRLVILSRTFNQEETKYLQSKNLLPEAIPIGYDAVALIVNHENTSTVLTTGQISQIMSGIITNWSQLNDSGKSGPIKLVFDAESSGVIRFLNEKLNLNKKISGDIQFSGDSRKLIEMVGANPNAIGFIGYNWLSESESLKVQDAMTKVSFVAVSGSSVASPANSYKPSLSSLFNKTYPLIRNVYALYTDPSASLARGFLSHLTSERGQKIIYRCGLKPENNFQRLVSIKEENIN